MGLTRGVRLDSGRFTVVAERKDERMARALLESAVRRDTFPGLPRPHSRVLIAVAPSFAVFRSWVGPYVPEWGAAIAVPDQQRVVMQGGSANSEAGDPLQVLRHELAHLALHETMGRLPPRWFDEGYASVAAGEFSRDQMFETSIGLVWRALPPVSALDEGFAGGGTQASWTYALSYRAVSELRDLGGDAAFAGFFTNWKSTGSFEKALRLTYGITSDEFDRLWRQQTRRRYGALSVLANFSFVAAIFAFLVIPVYVSKRRRDRRRLEEMRVADASREALEALEATEALGTSGMELPVIPEPETISALPEDLAVLNDEEARSADGRGGGPCREPVDSSILRND